MPRFDVTVAGELNLDLLLYGLPDELPRERELLASDMALTLGSSSAIVAHNLAALGCKVGFACRVGDDALGQIALDRLRDAGVDLSSVRQIANSATGLSVILPRVGWRNILTYTGASFELQLRDLDIDYLAGARHFHFSSYYLQPTLRPDVPTLFMKLKQRGVSISLDTNDDPDDLWGDDILEVLRLVDVFLPNEHELKRIANTEDLEQAMAKIGALVPLLVIKRGAAGAIAHRANERISGPPMKVTPIDMVGAGDSFDAGFLSEHLRGADLQRCLAAGNLAGAFSTTRTGGTEAFRDRAYREQFWREYQPR